MDRFIHRPAVAMGVELCIFEKKKKSPSLKYANFLGTTSMKILDKMATWNPQNIKG